MSEKKGRGVLYMKWGTRHDAILQRSIDSLKKHHPELPYHVHELPPDSTLLDKAKMFDVSPFEETLYLDVDTVVMGNLDYGFQFTESQISCCICECPWSRRYKGILQHPDTIEYNTGVLFFAKEASRRFFETWKKIASAGSDSSIQFHSENGVAKMPWNDQASFAMAMRAVEISPLILPMNWNLRPEWQRNWFGPIKIWHDYRDVPTNVLRFNEQQSQPDAIIDYFPGIDWKAELVSVSSEPVKLNLGDEPVEGFKQITNGTPVSENSVDEIVASHILQRFSHRKTTDIIGGWVKMLKPGGTIRISVPDHQKIVDSYNQGRHTDLVEMWWMGEQETEEDVNRAMFTESALRAAMLTEGLIRVSSWKGSGDCKASHPISLNLQGTKPKPTKVLNTHAVMSVPRFASTACYDSIARSLIALNVQLRTGFGAYWHHVLTFAIEEVMKDVSVEKILTLDYDSIIRPWTVMELYRLMEEHPEADAICGVQMRRGSEGPLVVLEGPDGKFDPSPRRDRFDGELTECLSGHFGCTLIRTEVFRKLKRPWFQGTASKDGSWRGEGFVAPDVDFWHQFKAQGFRLFQANNVPIGHLEEAIFWPDLNLRRVTQDIADHRTNGMPLGVRR